MARAQHEEDWRQQAACLDIDPELAFAERKPATLRWFAREVCGRCPVKTQCLEFALEAGCEFGVFGGVLPGARAKMPKVRRHAPCGTPAGYRRHKRLGEDACPLCLLANRLDDQGRRALRRRQVIEVPFERHLDVAA